MPVALFLFALLLSSCQPASNSPVPPVAVAAISPAASRLANILSKDRRFVYCVRWYAPGATTYRLDTLTLTATGAPCRHEPTQTGVEWLFPVDTTLTSRPRQYVGAIEEPGRFWLHPPRHGAYRILELNPFPEIRLAPQHGPTWHGQVYAPAGYHADSAWAMWSGALHVRYNYTLVDSSVLRTRFGKLACAHVWATGTSKLGRTALDSYFHPAYGFLRLQYRNIDQSRVELELVAVEVRSPSMLELVRKTFSRLPQ